MATPSAPPTVTPQTDALATKVAKVVQETPVKPAEDQAAVSETGEDEEAAPAPAVRPPAPTSWANLVARSSNKPKARNGPNGAPATESANGEETTEDAAGVIGSSAYAKSSAISLAEAVRDYRVGNENKIAFLEPRGLINTGNMCYMNSVSHSIASLTLLCANNLRFCKSLFSVSLFMISLIRSARRLLIVSRAILLYWMPCEYSFLIPLNNRR